MTDKPLNAIVYAPKKLQLPSGTDWKILLLDLFPDINPVDETPETVVLYELKATLDHMSSVLPMLCWIYDLSTAESNN